MNTENKIAHEEHVVLIGKDRYNPHRLVVTGAFSPLPSPRTRSILGPLQLGDLALVSDGRPAKLVRRLGSQESVQAILEALLLDSGERPFSAQEVKEAETLAREQSADIDKGRHDLRDIPTFTIDGEYSKDFDDAISAHDEGDQIRVWVHVADVTAYVKPGSALDHGARRRATSLYMPTQVAPMLPEILSNGVCSLMPGQERRAVTCEFTIKDGEITGYEFYRSLIRSDARLTYDHVNQIFLGLREPGPTYAAALAAARQASDADNFVQDRYRPEPSFQIEGGQVVGIRYPGRGSSQHLIERLMVMANRLAAQFINEHSARDQGLYRAHDGKNLDKVQTVIEKLYSMGIDADDLEDASEQIQEMFASGEINEDRKEMLLELVRNTNIAAEYTNEMRPHSGLEVAAYTHFTSPIRRYADIVVHRLILAALGLEDHTNDPMILREITAHINARTSVAKKLERKAEDVCRASYLRDQVGKRLTGIVSGMSERGVFVRFDEGEGFIHRDSLKGFMDPAGAIWCTDDGLNIHLGDSMDIEIESIDLVRGRIRLRTGRLISS